MYKPQRLRGDYGPARYRGDPGILDIFSKVAGVAGSILPGPLGTAATAVSRATASRSSVKVPPPRAVPRPSSSMTGIQVSSPFGSITAGRTTTQTTQYSASATPVVSGADGCPKGYKLNKTSYHLRDGTFVPARSKCVPYRTRNNTNQKALTKAISRCGAFDKMVKRNRKNLRKLASI